MSSLESEKFAFLKLVRKIKTREAAMSQSCISDVE